MRFRDRADAGRRLAERLEYRQTEHPLVLGLPRGGVMVAFEVAKRLKTPLDVVVVRKLGVPNQPELGFGAIGEDGVRVINPWVVRDAAVTPTQLVAVEREEQEVLQRRAAAFRRARPRIPMSGRAVVLVDDGIATGSTARAACEVVRAGGAARVILATPVAPRETVVALSDVADEVVCLETPWPFHAIGLFYQDFTQVDDATVVALLAEAARDEAGRAELG